jgi:histidinol-phosphate aminotransferase
MENPMNITPKSPSAEWLQSFLQPGLVASSSYKIDAPKVDLKIDQNESPFDWPLELKQKVCESLLNMPWNRYPEPYPTALEELVANYVGVSKGSILLSPGSNHLIALVLSAFGPNASKVVVARPSFPLYEQHLKFSGIAYEPWILNKDLEYDFALLPELPERSLVIFASPNNPVGNILERRKLVELLKKFPKTMFIGDEAYLEFASEPYTELLQDFSNLLLIRTFSKTMGAAGVRLGYLIGAKEPIAQVRKLMLPYLINRFSLAALPLVLSDKTASDQFNAVIQTTITERNRVVKELQQVSKDLYQIKNSQANFFLVRFINQETCLKTYRHLIDLGILVRNVSESPELSGCLRITIGTPIDNDRVINAFKSVRNLF